jgi:hypothetical protein
MRLLKMKNMLIFTYVTRGIDHIDASIALSVSLQEVAAA